MLVGGEVWRRAMRVRASPEPTVPGGQSLLRRKAWVPPCTPRTGSISSGTAQDPVPAKNTEKPGAKAARKKRRTVSSAPASFPSPSELLSRLYFISCLVICSPNLNTDACPRPMGSGWSVAGSLSKGQKASVTQTAMPLLQQKDLVAEMLVFSYLLQTVIYMLLFPSSKDYHIGLVVLDK